MQALDLSELDNDRLYLLMKLLRKARTINE